MFLNTPITPYFFFLFFRYNLACHRLETLLQNVDILPLNSANNAQYFLRKPDKALEEDSRVFSAYHDCAQLQLQLNLAAQAVQRLRVSLGSPRLPRPFRSPGNNQPLTQLVQHASTEQLRTTIRYLLDTLLSLLHANNGETAEGHHACLSVLFVFLSHTPPFFALTNRYIKPTPTLRF